MSININFRMDNRLVNKKKTNHLNYISPRVISEALMNIIHHKNLKVYPYLAYNNVNWLLFQLISTSALL